MEPTLPDVIKNPSDLGFDPQKFPEYRPNQLELAHQVVSSTKPLFLLEAPTGTGKSLLGLTVSKLKDVSRTVYLCGTKQLQDQVEGDFHIPLLKGRNNFRCLHFLNQFPDVTAEICSEFKASRGGCNYQSDCPYNKAKKAALAAPVALLNYSLFLSEANFVGGFSGLDYLICDEVDELENHLMSFVEVGISSRMMDRYKLGFPKFKTKLDSWKEWAQASLLEIDRDLTSAKDPKDMNTWQLKEYIRVKRTHRRLTFLVEVINDSWVMEVDDDPKALTPVKFKPVIVGPFAQSFLWKHTSQSLGMSATIMGAPAMTIDLGLHSWDSDFASIPSPFPIKDRTVYYSPVASVTHKTKDEAYPKILSGVEKILQRHPQDKVLLHTVSYDLAGYISKGLHQGTHTVLFHNSSNRVQTLESFKQMDRPCMLISPSMERGVDLPGDLCRVVIVAKVPYPNLGSPQVNKRTHAYGDGSLWYARRTARSIVQMTGRATRFLGDHSTSYILDEQFGTLVGKNGGIFPAWWRESVKYLDPKEL